MPKTERQTRVKRQRVNFTSSQLDTMETVFSQTQYPDVTVLDTLSDRMDLPIEKICTWFQNRRSKYRKESKTGHITMMRQQLFDTRQKRSAPQITDTCHVLTPAGTASVAHPGGKDDPKEMLYKQQAASVHWQYPYSHTVPNTTAYSYCLPTSTPHTFTSIAAPPGEQNAKATTAPSTISYPSPISSCSLVNKFITPTNDLCLNQYSGMAAAATYGCYRDSAVPMGTSSTGSGCYYDNNFTSFPIKNHNDKSGTGTPTNPASCTYSGYPGHGLQTGAPLVKSLPDVGVL